MNKFSYLVTFLASAALAFVVPASAMAESKLGAFSPESDVFAFAISQVCLPYLREGGLLKSYVGESGRDFPLNGVPAMRLKGLGAVYVGEGHPGSGHCYIIATVGETPHKRITVLNILAHDGYKLEALFGPNEHALADGHWTSMLEDYCFRVDNKVMRLRMTTATMGYLSTGFQRIPVQMNLSWDKDDESVKKGLCLAVP